MRKAFAVLLLAALAFGLAGTPALALNQPPLNLGLTDILDGALPGPGTYLTEYIQPYSANKIKKVLGGGDLDVGVANTLAMTQFVHVYKHQVLGGNLGADLLIPVVTISADSPLTTNPGWFGDITVGPFLQWFDTKLFGMPYFHRLELDFSIPTGEYDKKYALNPGSNIWVIEPYYAFTLFMTPKLSTSWRIHYTYSTENDDTKVKPGQVFHFNYSVEYEFFKNFRGAVAGYYLKQLSDDEVDGNKLANSKEQVFAIGPAVSWAASPNFFLGLKTQWETSAENRPEGNRTTFRMTYKF
jgi:anthranilate 1,2-dioxygenase (deaminating, decarboxylating) large subunit